MDIERSRWTIFRRLCVYYAECVRLDQRSTVHAKAVEEFKSIVCLDGRLPNNDVIQVQTRSEWNEWSRRAANADYLFLGYPLQRFRWQDKQTVVDYISPALIVPCRYTFQGTSLKLERVGEVRVNEGWLERRLPNLEERRAFVELLSSSRSASASKSEDSNGRWSDYAELLNHYYHDWCAERLNPNSVVSHPSLESLTDNGLYNRAAIIIPRKWKFTNKLHDELLKLAYEVPDDCLDRTALRSIFPHASRSNHTTIVDDQSPDGCRQVHGASPLSLNYEQQQAVDNAASHSLTVVVGPPGTGKSRVVASVLASHTLLGQSALFASRNHQALEAVVPRVNAITDPNPIMLRLSTPWGVGVDQSLKGAIGHLVSSDEQKAFYEVEQLTAAIERRLGIYREHLEVVDDIIRLREQLAFSEFELTERMLSIDQAFRDSFRPSAHLDQLHVLKTLGESLAPPGPPRLSLRWLTSWINFRLRWKESLERARGVDQRYRDHFDADGQLPAAPRGNSIELAGYYSECLHFWRNFAAINEAMLSQREIRESLSSLPDVDTACRAVNEAAAEVTAFSRQCCQVLAYQIGSDLTNVERQQLADILSALDNKSGLDVEEDRRRWEDAMRRSFPTFLKHYRLVSTTNLSIGRDVSLEPGVFDLLVVDEASQCDIASVVPLLYRAKRAAIVGDPMQLSHVTSLSAATDRHLRRQFRVDAIDLERFSYRTTSMFHLANTSERVDSRVRLRQHHRCHPAIAEYCNDSFYQGSWIVLTERQGSKGLLWTNIPDDSEGCAGGGATSRQQIETIDQELQRLDASGFDGTVGVVTPFRRQADLIRDRVFGVLSKGTIRKWRLLVDTADGFQGDERDIVLFSLVAGDRLPKGSLHFLSSGPNRFNVAVSRARRLLHVYGDASWARQSSISHIRKLAEACDAAATTSEEYSKESFRHDLIGPVWEPALANAMSDAGLEFYQQYPACGRFLDFALFKEGIKLNVEVDGEAYHRSAAGGALEEDVRRDQSLIAAGWTVMRFWVYQLLEDMDGCVDAIRQRLAAAPPNLRETTSRN